MDNSYINNNPIVVAVDIGTTKVCAVAGRKNFYGKLEILAVGSVENDGVLRGVVSNIEKTVSAITNAIRIVEQNLKKTVKSVHVGIAGQHIKCLPHKGSRLRDNGDSEISQADIQKLIHDMHRLVLPPGDKILHVFPQEYTIDNEQGIIDPVGMSGVKLEANFQIITSQTSAYNNIVRCIEKVGLKLVDTTLEPIASSDAVLSSEEKEAGIALVDIGGGTTDLAIYYDGILRHSAVIPFGGNAVTRDIKEGCNVMQNQAERLKTKFGCALADAVQDDKIITIPGLKGRENKEISQRNLALIVQARMEEILDYVMWEIKKSGYERKLTGGIILTGGGSNLQALDKLSSYYTAYETRLGLPIEHLAHGYHENVSRPEYATVLGLLYKAAMKAGESGVSDSLPAWMAQTANIPFDVVGVQSTDTSGTEAKSGTEETQQLEEVSSEATSGHEDGHLEKKNWWSKVKERAQGLIEGLDEDHELR